MSYRGLGITLFAGGTVPDADFYPMLGPKNAGHYRLPPASEASHMEQTHCAGTDSNQGICEQWLLINNDNVLQNIARAMLVGGVTETLVEPRVWRNDFVGGGGGRLGENEPFLQGLRAAWTRMRGRLDTSWPGARGEYNFGPNHDAEQSLRISKSFYELFASGQLPLWKVGAHGYVRIYTASDAFWRKRIFDKLLRWGYVTAGDSKDITLIEQVRRWFNEARAAGMDVGSWPHWDLGDRHTDGSDVLVHEKLLYNIIFGVGPREAQARVAVAAVLKGATIRPPIVGTLTNISGRFNQKPPLPALIPLKVPLTIPLIASVFLPKK
jgi:hypothetical protein